MPEVNESAGHHGLADTGHREQYATGATRENDPQRPRPELMSPYALERLALHYARGAQKYAVDNWAMGMTFRDTVGSMFRHVIKYMMRDRSEDHLAAIAWNAFTLMHFEEIGRADELDDRPDFMSLGLTELQVAEQMVEDAVVLPDQ